MNIVEHKDLAGNDIRVGDYVAYAALWSRSAVLKFGIVVALKERGNTGTIGVITVDRSWMWGATPPRRIWELQNNGREITLGFTDRCIVVSGSSVPNEVLGLLTGAYVARMGK